MKSVLVELEYKYGDVVKIKPIYDVHYGDNLCDLKALKQWMAEDEDSWFVMGGDILDCTCPNNRFYNKMTDTSGKEPVVDHQIRIMSEVFAPYKDRIWGIGTGNHEARLLRAGITNPAKRLADALEVPYLGISWAINLRLSEGGSRGRKVNIRGHHGFGAGAGRTLGGALTKYERDCHVWDCEIALYGHDHRLQASKVPFMSFIGSKIVSKPKLLCLCGSWVKTMSDNEDFGYAEQNGYAPVEIGGPVIHIKPDRNSVKYWADT